LWTQGVILLSQMDMQMVIYMLGSKEAWYYTNYLSIMMIPFMLIWPIFWLLFPLFSEMHAKRQYSKIKFVKQVLSKNFIAISIAFNVLMFVFAENIAYILFWEKYIASGIILQYSILFLVFNFLLQINFHILSWIWKVKDRVAIILIALVCNFVLNIILIKSIWVAWAALATGIWWVWIYIMSEHSLWKRYFHHLDYKFLMKNIIFIWFLGVFCFYFITPFFAWFWRIYSLLFLMFISILWFWFFIFVNYTEFRREAWELQKLRKGGEE
jgi:O-antigen/teichoic acid export membrane protein